MDELKLMEDYFWILENCKDPDITFEDNPNEKEFASMWLLKLCNDIYRGLEAKQIRNIYLLELSKCINNVELNKIFLQVPPKGPLPPIQGASNLKVDHKSIVNDMKKDAEESMPVVAPTNCQTHMSTKIFDDNRGACAYLALSLSDPKQGPIWMQMGGKKPFYQNNENTNQNNENPNQKNDNCNQNRNQNTGQECPPNACQQAQSNAGRNNRPPTPSSSDGEGLSNVNVTFGEFCLDAIARELAGYAQPEECPQLEAQLEKYAEFIKNYPVGHEAMNLQGSKLRAFLLLNLQTDLVQALEGCQ